MVAGIPHDADRFDGFRAAQKETLPQWDLAAKNSRETFDTGRVWKAAVSQPLLFLLYSMGLKPTGRNMETKRQLSALISASHIKLRLRQTLSTA